MLHLSPTVRILDLDGSVTAQRRLLDRLSPRIDRIDLRRYERRVRYFARRRWMAEIEKRLLPEHRDRLTLIGSGDYHHFTAPLLRAFHEPLSVVVFDTHPDWDRSSPWPCCGAWVREALRRPNLKRLVMIGLGRCDLEEWRVNWGTTAHLYSGRVEFFPYDCERSLGFGRHTADRPCATVRPRRLHSEISWRTVRSGRWDDLIEGIISRLPTEDVYISIDKDSLRFEEAWTNWEPGGLARGQVADAVTRIAEAKRVVGADITGEYSPVRIDPRLFRMLAAWERPKLPVPAESDLDRNEETNLALVEAFGLLTPDAAGISGS